MGTATARANANIAFIKYWGNQNDRLRLPANPSISMNLGGLYAETTVAWDRALTADSFALNGKEETGAALERVQCISMCCVRASVSRQRARVVSANNFPTGAGIASSAAAFAALSVAGAAAAGADLSERELTTMARLGSGSASRSVPGGLCRMVRGGSARRFLCRKHRLPGLLGHRRRDRRGEQDAQADVGSSAGHQSANTSDLQAARVAGAGERFAICKQAILNRNFATFAEVVEHDSNLMHAVMMTSRPPLFYWLPPTLALMDAVRQWRAEGLRVCYTLDAGPNVHCICVRKDAEQVSERLRALV